MSDTAFEVQQVFINWWPDSGNNYIRFAPYAMLTRYTDAMGILVNIAPLATGEDDIDDWEDPDSHAFTPFPATREEDGTYVAMGQYLVVNDSGETPTTTVERIFVQMDAEGELLQFVIGDMSAYPRHDFKWSQRVGDTRYTLYLTVARYTAIDGWVTVFLLDDEDDSVITSAAAIGKLKLVNGAASGELTFSPPVSNLVATLQISAQFRGLDFVVGEVTFSLTEPLVLRED